MNPVVKKDILSVLEKGSLLLMKEDSFGLHQISNRNVHNASIFQDEDSIMVGIVMYALSKVIQRAKIDKNYIAKQLASAKEGLKMDDVRAYRKAMQKITARITEVDIKMGTYVTSVIEQAQLKKGFKLFDHGISVARAAKVLGVSQWELMDYIGKTNVFEESATRVDIRNRLQLARKLFS